MIFELLVTCKQEELEELLAKLDSFKLSRFID